MVPTLPGRARFLELPLEIRYRVYDLLIYPGMPGDRSALTVTSLQLRREVHDWLAGRKFTIDVRPWQKNDYTAPAWYVPVLERATNIQFDCSCLPSSISHLMVDMLCRIWRNKCAVKKVAFTVLDDSVPARKCRWFPGDLSDCPDTLPSRSKELICDWLMLPIKMVLSDHLVARAVNVMAWKQPTLLLPDHDQLELHFRSNEAATLLIRTFSEHTIFDLEQKVWIPLVSALFSGHRAVVEVLVESGPVDLRKATDLGTTLIMELCHRGWKATVDALLEGLDRGEIAEILDLQDMQGRTALSHAASGSQQKMVQHLLDTGADPNIRDCWQMTPLHHAVRVGGRGVIKTMCEHDEVDNVARDAGGRTVLHYAAEQGEINNFDLLKEQSGLDIDVADSNGQTPLFYAARSDRAALTYRLLKYFDASFDGHDKHGRTPLSHAAGAQSYRTVELLLQAGASCEPEDRYGRTPLFYAVKSGSIATTVRLAKHLKDGNVALSIAGQLKQAKVERSLLDMSKEVANWDQYNLQTLLVCSARDGRSDIVRQLLGFHEVNADVMDENGRTPLSHAAEKGHHGIIRLLLRNGAERYSEDMLGRSPSHYASWRVDGTLDCLLKEWM